MCCALPHLLSVTATNRPTTFSNLTTKDAALLDAATAATVDAAVTSSGLDGLLSSYSFTLLPVRTVGVQGDGRTYSYVAALTKTGPVSDWEEVLNVAKLIPRVCHEVNRVVYVWGEPIAGPVTTITPTTLTPDVLEQLREADSVVNKLLVSHKLVTKVAQVPVVSVPVDPDFAGDGNSTRRSIAIRTFLTADFMTGVPVVPGNEIPQDVLLEMVAGISKVEGIARVMYDLTAKPPGTTEWE